jgi:phosphoenolpyruvate carboxykinase (ATP)
MLGTREIKSVEGKDMGEYDPRRFYSQEEIDFYLQDIVDGRREYTELIADEGLKDEIVAAAEGSFEIAPKSKARAFVSRPDEGTRGGGEAEPEKEEAVKEEASPVDRFWKPTNRIPSPPRWRNR